MNATPRRSPSAPLRSSIGPRRGDPGGGASVTPICVPVASVQGTLALDLSPRHAPPELPDLRALTAPRPSADVVPIDPSHRGRLELWVHRFVQASVEIVGGDRPASQLLRWTTRTVYADLQRRALLVARAGGHQPGAGRVQPVRPHVVSVHASFVSDGVAEASARVRYGARSRALALRFEKRGERWLCSAMEFA